MERQVARDYLVSIHWLVYPQPAAPPICCAISYTSSSIPHLFSNQLLARSKNPSLIRLWTLKNDDVIFPLSRDFVVFFFFIKFGKSGSKDRDVFLSMVNYLDGF